MRLALTVSLLFASASAVAGKSADEGVPLVITVVDARNGRPIPFAAVRESQERELHPVNRETGQFSTTALYPDYNGEIALKKGMELTLEITAAAYAPLQVQYKMKGRNNQILVRLEAMQIEANIGEEPPTPFKRDLPVGGRPLSPEELAQIEAEAEAARKARETAVDQ